MNPELPAATPLPNPFRDPIGIAKRHGRWMLAALALGVAASLLLWSRSAPRYFAEATVVVARSPFSQRIIEPGLEDSGFAMTEALAAEVLSLSNLAKLVADFDLYPELEGRATMTEIAERVRSNVAITLAAAARSRPRRWQRARLLDRIRGGDARSGRRRRQPPRVPLRRHQLLGKAGAAAIDLGIPAS